MVTIRLKYLRAEVSDRQARAGGPPGLMEQTVLGGGAPGGYGWRVLPGGACFAVRKMSKNRKVFGAKRPVVSGVLGGGQREKLLQNSDTTDSAGEEGGIFGISRRRCL